MDELLGFAVAALALVFPGFGEPVAPTYHGYIEADYVYVAAADPGRIEELRVREGDSVAQGELLFALETGTFAASLKAAEANVTAAEANWRNLETGSRDEEIAVIRASLEQAESTRALAETKLSRSQDLQTRGVASDAQVDADRAALRSAEAAVAQLQAQLDVAELPARSEQLAAALAAYEAARANADVARSRLADRQVFAPLSARVEQVYFRAGEVAGAGTPVVSLLPPESLFAILYIPEADRSRFAVGDTLALSCDGCPDGLTATLSFLAADPQNTPPIIYSREERGRLVFMARARLDGETGLLPGQPVSLTVPE